jgi:glycosyltransferase involved in cell wall biosynthesis
MRVLALTHAQLTPDGLSPVSCERADSIVGAWGARLGWDIDVVHTKGTKWRGIWPGGKGMKISIVEEAAPAALLMGTPELFSVTAKRLLKQNNIGGIISLFTGRIRKKVRAALSAKGMMYPYEMHIGAQWGEVLAQSRNLRQKKYDFLFACIGYGDEYLLVTAKVLSDKLGIPMVVDFRDLWSQHHEPERFNAKQRQQLRKYEHALLKNTVMASVPQPHMRKLLEEWCPAPVHISSHSAYIGPAWKDGEVVSDEFRVLYAGKLYPGPVLEMLMQILKRVANEKLAKPVKYRFFVDNTTRLKELVKEYGIREQMEINEWASPEQLWKELRSAHLLINLHLDLGDYPIITTKSFQYAATGRDMIAINKNHNSAYEDFMQRYNAGHVTYSVDDAVSWVKQYAQNEKLYKELPPLRNVPTREEEGVKYGQAIAQVISKK